MIHDEAKLDATGCGCQRIQCAQRSEVQHLRKLLTAEGAVYRNAKKTLARIELATFWFEAKCSRH